MDAVVVILSIFSLISAGVIAFLINDRRTQDKTFKLGDELEKKIISEYYQRCFGEDLPESSINITL